MEKISKIFSKKKFKGEAHKLGSGEKVITPTSCQSSLHLIAKAASIFYLQRTYPFLPQKDSAFVPASEFASFTLCTFLEISSWNCWWAPSIIRIWEATKWSRLGAEGWSEEGQIKLQDTCTAYQGFQGKIVLSFTSAAVAKCIAKWKCISSRPIL